MKYKKLSNISAYSAFEKLSNGGGATDIIMAIGRGLQYGGVRDAMLNFAKVMTKLGEQYPDVHDALSKVSISKTISDLNLAAEIKPGYYKSRQGTLYVQVHGVTIDTSRDLGRTGYNGEDRTVWLTWTEVLNNSIIKVCQPIAAFFCTFMLNKSDKLLIKTTKREYDKAIQVALQNMLTTVQDEHTEQCVDYLTKLSKLQCKYRDIIGDAIDAYTSDNQ